jgi:predicted GNAT family acetyltransferase
MTEVHVSDNPSASRFEAMHEGVLAAFAQYKLQGNGVLFTHTEVMPQFEGKGVASKLAQFALDDVRSRSLQAVPACSFIADYIRKNPQYLELVSQEKRGDYKL